MRRSVTDLSYMYWECQFLGDPKHRCVTLLNSEVEWVVLSEAMKEVIFLIQFLRSMKISDKLPVIV